MTLSVGTLFKCRPIENLYDFSGGLYRTAGECLETQPDPETLYVMCKDRSVQSISDPGRPIGWELGDGWYRLTQTGFESKKCEIEIVGYADITPEGNGFIGSQVHYEYSREIAFDATSQHAQITDGDDDDEDEVTSSISFYVKD
jgi:hypothetical protein